MREWENVKAFHQKFKIPQSQFPGFYYSDREMMKFRIKFLQEELDEFKEAVEKDDTVKGFDALLDLVYVALGTAYICNFPWYKGWQAVQDANMRKVRGNKKTSTRGSEYDVVKPSGWIGPELKLHSVLLAHEHELKTELIDRTKRKFDDDDDNDDVDEYVPKRKNRSFTDNDREFDDEDM